MKCWLQDWTVIDEGICEATRSLHRSPTSIVNFQPKPPSLDWIATGTPTLVQLNDPTLIQLLKANPDGIQVEIESKSPWTPIGEASERPPQVTMRNLRTYQIRSWRSR